MRPLFLIFCLPLALILAGCGTPANRRLASPSIQITGLNAAGDGYALKLRLVNSNTVPLIVNRSTHMLHLGDQRLGRIEDREPFGLPALRGVPHTVAIPVALADKIRAYLASHPGKVRASTESTLEILLTGEETMTLETHGGGLVDAR